MAPVPTPWSWNSHKQEPGSALGHDKVRIAKTGCCESRGFAGSQDWRNQLEQLAGEQITENRRTSTKAENRCAHYLRALYRSPPIGLNPVHARIGNANDGVDARSVIGRCGHAHTGLDVQLQAVLHQKFGFYQRVQYRIGLLQRGLRSS